MSRSRSTSLHRRDRTPLPVMALLVWVGGPCLVLVVLLTGFQPSANWVEPPERWGTESVFVTQILLSALIFPRLLRTLAATGASISLAAVPLAGGMLLAGGDLLACGLAFFWLATWLAALGLVHQMMGTRERAGVWAAVPLFISILLILIYTSSEWPGGSPEQADGARPWLPLAIEVSSFRNWRPWVAIGAIGPIGIFFALVHRRTRAQQNNHSLSTS